MLILNQLQLKIHAHPCLSHFNNGSTCIYIYLSIDDVVWDTYMYSTEQSMSTVFGTVTFLTVIVYGTLVD